MMKKRIITWVLFLMLIMAEICPVKIQGAVQPAPEISAPGAVLMEPSTGTVLYEKNGEEQRSPASITKIMTLLLIFEALEDGQITLEEEVVTSAYAKSMGGSQVFLEEGEKQTVETLIKCIVVASGNDASVVMAEHLAGSEEEFVKRMNEKAGELGMIHTQFEDCCGLTDSEEHYTTASDVAIVSRELITRFPRILEYSSIWMENIIHRTAQGEKEFCLTNTNKLIRFYSGATGLKTGFTSGAGYCLSATAKREGMELIAVVMGCESAQKRTADCKALLDYGFATYSVVRPGLKAGRTVAVHLGKQNTVPVELTERREILVDKAKRTSLTAKVELAQLVPAPVEKGQQVGTISVYAGEKLLIQLPLAAAQAVAKLSFGDVFKLVLARVCMIAPAGADASA